MYDDGHTHCHSCKHHTTSPKKGHAITTEEPKSKHARALITGGNFQDLPARKLTEKTCEKWGYEHATVHGEKVQVANYRNTHGKLVNQKVRNKDKEFYVTGADTKDMPLYGQWLWRDGGKSVTITEGEIDAMTMSQCFQHKWPVVSLPLGASSAAKSLKHHLEWLDKFESIVLMFDMDEPGRAAIAECVKFLPIGKVKIARLPEKDPNETYLKRGSEVLVSCFWNASSYRPDGVISGADMTVAKLKAAVEHGFTLPYPKLQSMMAGFRKRELTMLCAGTGVGKSTWMRELAYYMHQEHGCTIGNVFLEENNAKTAQAYIALHNNVALGALRADTTLLTDAKWQEGLDEVIKERMWFYNHFGSLDSDNLISKLSYMAKVLKVDFIALDHISIVVSGQETSAGGERKDIDILMTRLRSLIEETGVGIIAITHLNSPDGAPHEEGGRVTLRNLRGSGSLKQLSDNVLALERDQQGDDPTQALIRVLKCRELGETGEADVLNYNRSTGRLLLSNRRYTGGDDKRKKKQDGGIREPYDAAKEAAEPPF